MAKHIVKCYYCSQDFDTNEEEFVKVNSRRYAHKSCADHHESLKTQEERDKEILESYIKELFQIDSITPKIKKQINSFKKENNYTYSGMYKTLKYFFEIRGNPIEKANGGIGIIPYVWNEAYTYWRAIWEAQQKNQNVNVEEYILPTRKIYISSPEREPMKHIRPLFTFLDEG